MTVWYFGCYEQSGHFLYRRGGFKGATNEKELPKGCPFRLGDFDTGLLTNNDPYSPRTENQGEGVLAHRDGWTYLSFWDRTVDKRGVCNSGFLAEGELTFTEIVETSKKTFPEVWARFTFEVKLQSD